MLRDGLFDSKPLQGAGSLPASGQSNEHSWGVDDSTQALLLALCRARLTAEDAQQVSDLFGGSPDWQELTRLACLHGVVTLVRHNLLQLGVWQSVPVSARQTMQQAANQVAFDGMLNLRQLSQVLDALQGAGIQPILLKGYALAALLYQDPVLRPSADIDLLVRQEQLPGACQALKAIGGRLPPSHVLDYQLSHGYDLPVALSPGPAGDPMLMELHWDLAPRGLFPLDLDAWRARAQVTSLDGSEVACLSIEDTLLHLALHMRKHRYVGLRWLCDVAELLRQHGHDLDWPYVLDGAQSAGLRTLLFTSLSLARDLLQAPVAQELMQQLSPAAWRRLGLSRLLQPYAVLTPLEAQDSGWTRLAPVEILLLDRPTAMFRELRYRLLPPAEALGNQSAVLDRRQRITIGARRLAGRMATLLRR